METRPVRLIAALAVAAQLSVAQADGGTTYRFYDGVTAHVHNPDGRPFAVTLGVRDINHRMHGPAEMLVKIYGPDGRPVVREIIPDDGIVAIGSGGPYALAACRALVDSSKLDAEKIVRKSLEIAADICIYTNRHISVESLK